MYTTVDCLCGTRRGMACRTTTNRSGMRRKFVWSRRALGRALVGVLGALSLAVPASAQIYSWRDARGVLVLSNRRPTSAAKTYAVPAAESVRATRYATEKRGRIYDALIVEHATRGNIRADLVRAVVQVESAFDPAARSPRGALGLMQLMPATIRTFGVSDPFDPADNVRAGVAYLRQLLDRYNNNEELALAAYNAGPSAVDRHGQTIPPYAETRDYVTRVNSMSARPLAVPGDVIYRTTELIDGRPVPCYSDRRPTRGSYEIVPKP
jgi:soluble lytic murein transglycosylase-like protein